MFRKITHIVFALFLLTATTGVSVSMHFCKGKLVSTSILKEAKACCSGKGSCCENKTFKLEIEDQYTSPPVLEKSKIIELDVLFPILFFANFKLIPEAAKAFEVFTDTSPPPTLQSRLSLLQTYRC